MYSDIAIACRTSCTTVAGVAKQEGLQRHR